MTGRPCLPLLLCVALALAGGGAWLQAALVASAPAPPGLSPAPGMFLVATRDFQDPDFRGSVVYLLQHDAHASFGVIVNRPTAFTLADRQPDLAGTALAALPLHDGGPVNPELTAILVENRAWEHGYDAGLLRHVRGAIFASLNPAIFQRLLSDRARPYERVRAFAGHIGWVPGQLAGEIERRYWHLVDGNVDAVFGARSGTLWERLIERLEPAQPLLAPEVPTAPGSR